MLAIGDEHARAEGLPDLPVSMLEPVRRESVRVRIIAVDRLEAAAGRPASDMDFCEQGYRLTLDHGVGDGLVPGVELLCEDECGGQTSGLARVIDGGEHAIAQMTAMGVCDELVAPQPGWVLETGAYSPPD